LNTYPISTQVDANGLLRYGIKNQREKKHLLVFHTEDLQPLCGFYSFEAQQQTEPDKLLAAPLFLESPEVASTGAYSECSNVNFFLYDTLIEFIATSGMVGTYAIHQFHLFMILFSDAAEDVQWKFMSEQFARLDPDRSTPHLSLAVGTKEELHWPKSRSTFNSAKVNQV
jgi:hypothetical protein